MVTTSVAPGIVNVQLWVDAVTRGELVFPIDERWWLLLVYGGGFDQRLFYFINVWYLCKINKKATYSYFHLL